MNRNPKHPSVANVDVLSMLRRHGRRFATVAIFAAILALVGGFFLPRQYHAEAVFERRNDMVLTEITNTGATRSFQNPRAALVKELTGEVAIDKTLARVSEAMAAAGHPWGSLQQDRLRGELRRGLRVSFDFATDPVDRVRVAFTHDQPLVAQLAVNALVAIYIEDTRAAMDARLKESASFFEGEVARCREQIAAHEDQMLAFEVEHSELLPESPGGMHAATSEANSSLVNARQAQAAATLRVEALTGQLQQTPRTTPTITRVKNPELARLEERIRQLTDQRNRHLLVDRMKPEHPDVLAVDGQLESLARDIAAMPAVVVSATTYTDNPRYGEIELMLTQARTDEEAAKAYVAMLEREAEDHARRADALYPVRAKYKALAREVSQAQRQLNFWEDNLRRVQMTLSAEHGNRGVQLAFIKPCGELHRPASPHFEQVLLAALAAGLAAGSVAMFLAHRNRSTTDDPDDLARELDIPLLGSVSPLLTVAQRRLERLRAWIVPSMQLAAMATLLAAVAAASYVAMERPDLWAKVQSRAGQLTATLGAAPAAGDH